ncbi:hypothetical protein ACHHYP_04525 [Achlya hypogyna]|uniref:Uncharacterized protein n=1 Tax=Achlya hypogyna TaxID=1202772 RepID=A0A1V9Z0R7_ACHHY|nr:hypothetical protein ACHHYP_04525 [Achlya hypogyna]
MSDSSSRVEVLPAPGILPIFRRRPEEIPNDEPEPVASPKWLVNESNKKDAKPLTPAVAETLYLTSSHTPQEIARVGILLASTGLPIPAVNTVLDQAGCVLVYDSETAANEGEYAPADVEYLRFTVPSVGHTALEARCIALVLECTSHDQGWASETQELNGTFNGCYSWVEYQVAAPDGTLTVPRTVACLNMRADSNFRHYVQYVTDAAVLAALTPGATVSLHLRAEFGGWANYARYGRIAVVYAAGLSEDSM